MADAMPNLGQKMVEAAWMAVAMHLRQAQSVEETRRRQAVIGGADPAYFTEEALPMATDRSQRSPLLAEGGAE